MKPIGGGVACLLLYDSTEMLRREIGEISVKAHVAMLMRILFHIGIKLRAYALYVCGFIQLFVPNCN